MRTKQATVTPPQVCDCRGQSWASSPGAAFWNPSQSWHQCHASCTAPSQWLSVIEITQAGALLWEIVLLWWETCLEYDPMATQLSLELPCSVKHFPPTFLPFFDPSLESDLHWCLQVLMASIYFSPFSLPSISPNKFLVHLVLSWHLFVYWKTQPNTQRMSEATPWEWGSSSLWFNKDHAGHTDTRKLLGLCGEAPAMNHRL